MEVFRTDGSLIGTGASVRAVCEQERERATLTGANLRRADLTGADLREANLRGADLRWADLRGADLTGAGLREADLAGADLRRADLRWAELRGADLTGAILDTGESWEVYLTQVVPALLIAGGQPLGSFAAHWTCHDWDNCPMAHAFQCTQEEETPLLLWPRVRQFVQFFDASLIPWPLPVRNL